MKQERRLRVKELLQYGILMMLTGTLAGIAVKGSVDMMLARKGLPGGEILLIPLLMLTFWMGVWTNDLWRVKEGGSDEETA